MQSVVGTSVESNSNLALPLSCPNMNENLMIKPFRAERQTVAVARSRARLQRINQCQHQHSFGSIFKAATRGKTNAASLLQRVCRSLANSCTAEPVSEGAIPSA
eukprot:285157-Pleurochrysis_carterae.AAC.1